MVPQEGQGRLYGLRSVPVEDRGGEAREAKTFERMNMDFEGNSDFAISITAANDQEIMQAKEWLRQATALDVAMVWTRIQQDYRSDPVMEIVSRFAQIGMSQVVASMAAPER